MAANAFGCDWLIACCDLVKHPASGGVSIVGVFRTLTVLDAAARVAPLVIAARIVGTPKAQGTLVVRLTAPDGQDLYATDASSFELDGFGYIDAHVTMPPLAMRQEGLYQVSLVINGDEVKAAGLLVRRGRVN